MNLLLKSLSPLIIALFLLPITAFAHGSVKEHVSETSLIELLMPYITFTAAILFVVFIILRFIFKRKMRSLNIRNMKERKNKLRLNHFLIWIKVVTILWLVIAVVAGSLSLVVGNNSEVTFKHVHGLDFTADGDKILVPSHDGLKVFEKGSWHTGKGESIDYMGFSVTDDGFYSSGHPGNSELKNPMGIIKSTDEGKTLSTLALSGESDFHAMDVGYNSHVIYVFNTAPNSIMNSSGFYYSIDDAKSWKQIAVNGLTGQPSSIAVPPIDTNGVAIGAKNGVYISSDHGNTVKNIFPNHQVTAVTYGFDGEIWAGTIDAGAELYRINPKTKESLKVDVPVKSGDTIGYIAINPKRNKEIAIATFNKDIYLSKDAGSSWVKIVSHGKGKNIK